MMFENGTVEGVTAHMDYMPPRLIHIAYDRLP